MLERLQSNIWKYTILLVVNKRIFVAILGVYYLTIPGVTPFWIGIFLLVGNGASLVFDVPSSFVADKIGHKYALVLSRISMIVSTLLFLFATNIWWLIAGSIFLSMGFAFMSGVGSAFMHETLRAIGREGDYRTVMGKASSLGFAIPAIIAVLIPLTVSISYKLPFIIGLVLDTAGLLVALTLVRPPVVPEHISETRSTNYIEVVQQGLALRFFRIALFSGLVSALLDGIGGFRGPYQLLVGVPVVWFGVFFGAGRLGASLMLAYSGKIHRFVGNVYSYQRAQIVIYGLLLLALGLITNPWVVVIVFIIENGLQYGMSQIDTGYLLDIIRDSKFKATLLSTSNQLENILSMVVVGITGYAITQFGYQHSFLVLSIIFLTILIPLHLYILNGKEKLA